MKIIYSKIFYNEINPDENFPDYGSIATYQPYCAYMVPSGWAGVCL